MALVWCLSMSENDNKWRSSARQPCAWCDYDGQIWSVVGCTSDWPVLDLEAGPVVTITLNGVKYFQYSAHIVNKIDE